MNRICEDKKRQPHREDGPAIEYASGSKAWYIHGKLHRIYGPAYERYDGTKYWYFNEQRHRIDGPAVEAGETKEWFVYSCCITTLNNFLARFF